MIRSIEMSPLQREEIIARFNQLIETPKDFIYCEANFIACMLSITRYEEPENNQNHWRIAAQDLLTACILHVVFSDYVEKSFQGILIFISQTFDKDSNNCDALLNAVINSNHGNNEELHYLILAAFDRHYRRPVKERDTILYTIKTSLYNFLNYIIVQHAGETSKIIFAPTQAGKGVNFLVTGDNDEKRQ